jgi:CO dehydrogenase/acetyl-CoA synthase delta subunit
MIKGVEFEFGNGEKFIVPPLSLGSLDILEAEYGKMNEWEKKIDKKFVLDVVGLSLRRNYPDITDDKLKNELLDVSNMNGAVNAVLDIGGLIRSTQEISMGEKKPAKK